ncbi:putative RNA-directed DNA polymerase, partial [Tanacetum coccineum]
SGLIDLSMGGKKFTRMNRYDTKLSKLDRILVSPHFISMWPNAILTALPRVLSDHCSLVLQTHSADYGPIPFKFFNSWLLHEDLANVISHGWSNVISTTNPQVNHQMTLLKCKLQQLKSKIRIWRKKVIQKNERLMDSLKAKVDVLEIKAENEGLDDHEISECLSSLKCIEEMEHVKNLDLMQKAKIKWAIEGDENSKFFHGILNNNFSCSRINGLSIHGFETSLLDAQFTNKEIKDAVWSCGGEKASGPDGFTFKFIKRFWDTMGNDFVEMVKRFEVDGTIPKGCNSSFIALVPKIKDPIHIKDYRPISLIGCQYKVVAKVLANRLLQVIDSIVSEVQTAYIKGRQIIDGPLIVNEFLSWAAKKKERFFILKVDFEKAFDSLDWDFLDNTMEQMGFSLKWRKWIRGCLDSAYGSIIVNGSPTKEFKIHKGLRQGLKVGSNNVDISHLQFADDALIFGDWSLENAKNLFRILRCFYMASGLKINFSKCKFFGVGVHYDETQSLASTLNLTLNLQPSSLPCTYLGLPIGANMNKGYNWKPIIEKFHKTLTKAKTLSYGGRLTLIKSVLGALGTYFFSVFKAPKYVIDYLEKLRRNFFWGGSLDSNKLTWISWKKFILLPLLRDLE